MMGTAGLGYCSVFFQRLEFVLKNLGHCLNIASLNLIHENIKEGGGS